MGVNVYQETAEDGISLAELELYHLITDYRSSKGLSAIPLSKALTATAGRHALDTVHNLEGYPVGAPGESKGHSWSDAPYDGRNPETYDNMWFAPKRLGTGYDGYGYEISTGYPRTPGYSIPDMTPSTAFKGWLGSEPHRKVIANEDPWLPPWHAWKAIGIGLYEEVSHVWFGADPDPTGAPLILGSSQSDGVTLTGFDDRFIGFAGDDTIDGGAGLDIVLLQDLRRNCTVHHGDGVILVHGADGARTLMNVERVGFDDGTLVLDPGDAAFSVYRLYEAALDRAPDGPGLTAWTYANTTGMSMTEMARQFMAAPEFVQRFGNPDNAGFVDLLYRNVLDRPADEAGASGWLGALASGEMTREHVLLQFADSVENIAKVNATVGDGIWLA